jgi:glycerol-3-phosphate dehydrogenase (NAD(P)+)
VSALGVIGAGAFGTALASVVAGAGATVHLFADDAATAEEINRQRTNERRLPGVAVAPGVRASADLAEVTGAARLLVLAVPSPRVAEVVRALGAVTDGRHLLVHALGAPVGMMQTASMLIQAETSIRRVGVLAGPALARDLAEHRPCSLVVASLFDEVIQRSRAALAVPGTLHVYGSHDLVGVELASGVSGGLTVALGLADGLGAHPGPRAALVCRAIAEGTRLLVAAGARERTFSGLAGLGNLLVRAASERSDDYRLGLEIARGEPLTRKETEGSRAAVAAVQLADRLNVRVRTLAAVAAVTHGGVPVAQAAARLSEGAAEEE